jgi:dTDP-4-amino-4,6-dideoxygalactose transaminase
MPDAILAPNSSLPFLPFALPDIGDEEIAAVVECLRSGWVTTGPTTRQFEQDFAAYLGGGVETISVNSATAGLHLALEALGIGPGDEVIVPTLTFTATAEVVRYLGAHPVFVDSDPATLNIATAAIAAAITARTRAIIPVHYAGLACDMDAILELAAAHKLKVVEDAAHAFPTRYRGRLVGTLDSDITVFSFYANKTMTTGEGGMVVTRDPALASRIRMMRIHGISKDAFDRYVSKTPAWFYEVVAAGFKYNLTDIAAAIGIEQLRKIDRFLGRRQSLARAYTEGLAGLPLLLPPGAPVGGNHAWHLYVVRLTEAAPLTRDELIGELSRQGIGTSVHFIPLHRQPYWRDTCALSPDQFPVAEASFQAMLTLPLYTKMSDADQQRVIVALRHLLS